MDALLTPILSYVLLYKYIAIFFVVYTGAVIVPWPANAMLLAVGAFASQGFISFWISLAVAVIANCLGDYTGYWVARRFGARFIHKFKIDKVRFFIRLKEELVTDAGVTLFITRFAGSLSSITNFLAGFVEVPFMTFVWPDLLGNFIEPGVALTLGYIVGNYWSDFSNFLSLLAALVAAAALLFILTRIYRRMMRKYAM
ncbi:MAG TPA: VTT domain-containing protein [Candidatus Paceibacterota bacterium]|nr:VTT domain-containing protein [Candidatus Paceibacterota bacterium]